MLTAAIILIVLVLANALASALLTPRKPADEPAPVVSRPAAEPPVVSQPEPQAPVTVSAQAHILVTGDLIIHNAILKNSLVSAAKNQYDFQGIFPLVKPYVSDADYAVANLETTLGGSNYSGYPSFNTPDSLVTAARDTGFDLLLTANNHAYDSGTKGMRRTVQVLRKKKIDHIGTVADETEKRYLVREVNGIRLGMVCYTYESNGKKTGKKYLNGVEMGPQGASLINSFSYNRLDSFYRELQGVFTAMQNEGAELTVVFIHWGTEYQLKPNGNQKKIAQQLCDMGADVIIGGHPHVVQSVDLLTGKTDSSHRTLCLYSTGNAISNQRIANSTVKTGQTEDGVLFGFDVTRFSDGRVAVTHAQALPTWVDVFKDQAAGRTVFRILPLDGTEAELKSRYSLSAKRAAEAEQSRRRTQETVDSGIRKACAYYRDAYGAILSASDLA